MRIQPKCVFGIDIEVESKALGAFTQKAVLSVASTSNIKILQCLRGEMFYLYLARNVAGSVKTAAGIVNSKVSLRTNIIKHNCFCIVDATLSNACIV